MKTLIRFLGQVVYTVLALLVLAICLAQPVWLVIHLIMR